MFIQDIKLALKKDEVWAKAGGDSQVINLLEEIDKSRDKIRECKDIAKSLQEVLNIVSCSQSIPKLVHGFYNGLGDWNEDNEKLSSEIKNTLTWDNVFEVIANDFSVGCGCKKSRPLDDRYVVRHSRGLGTETWSHFEAPDKPKSIEELLEGPTVRKRGG